MPKAINSVVFRIAVFYVGSVILLALLLPFTSYQKGVSPFVTFFGSIGIQGVDVIMNLVVLTAALSSLNAGFTPPAGSCAPCPSTAPPPSSLPG